MRYYKVYLLLLLIPYGELFSQVTQPTVKLRKINLKSGYSLVKEDTSVYAHADTVFFIPVQQEYYIKKGKAGTDVFQKISQHSSKSRIAKVIANDVLRKSAKRLPTDTVNTKLAETYFDSYQNLVIRKIDYRRLQPFGSSVLDTVQRTDKWYLKLGNNTHFRTAQWIIRNNMLFKEGELLNPDVMSDNERVLRELPYFNDVKIIVRRISADGDSVDIEVITKDVWAVGVGVEVTDIDQGYVQIWNNNIFGLGKTLDNKIYWDLAKGDQLGYDGVFKMDNIGGSFVNSAVQLINRYGTQSYRANMNRGFFTPNIKWAGGASVEYMTTRQYVNVWDTLDSPIEYRDAGFWLGRSFSLRTNGVSPARSNIILTGGVTYYDFLQRPVYVNADAYYRFHDRVLTLGSVSFTRQGFYKSNLIYNFGRTEDIPFGHMISITSGIESSEYNKRLYSKFFVSRGGYLGEYGYLYSMAEMGSFWHSKMAEQIITRVQLGYFSNLGEVGLHSIRHFVNLSYVQGNRMFTDDYLTINKNYGIRGFRDDSIRGLSKLALNFESNLFTPYYLIGFRFAVFAFADVALISKTANVFQGSPYYGIGMGVRLKNERLVLPAIQIRFVFYPNIDPGNMFNMIGESKLNPKDFYVRQPELVRFQ